MQDKIKICVESYNRLQNLKKVSQETHIPWQTVYWYLKKAGIAVISNKALYGSYKDKFACRGEEEFEKIIPYAENQNKYRFQPKIDFIVKGYGIEVKSAKLTISDNNKRWAFSLKKQNKVADFFILFAFDDLVKHIFLLPKDMLRAEMKTISVPLNLEKSKWRDFLISKEELKDFFDMIDSKIKKD